MVSVRPLTDRHLLVVEGLKSGTKQTFRHMASPENVLFVLAIIMLGILNMPCELSFLQSARRISPCKSTFRVGQYTLGVKIIS